MIRHEQIAQQCATWKADFQQRERERGDEIMYQRLERYVSIPRLWSHTVALIMCSIYRKVDQLGYSSEFWCLGEGMEGVPVHLRPLIFKMEPLSGSGE